MKDRKQCEQCGLMFENRKRFTSRGQWEAVKYCSDRCRKAARKHKA